MNPQLCITVRFLSGRYHGEEWPPSPARLLQALVAGANTGCRVLDRQSSHAALRWMEHLSPPEIIAPEADRGFSYKSYAPNNDSDARKVVDLVRQGRALSDAMRTDAMITTKHYNPLVLSEGEETAIHYLWPLPPTITPDDQAQAEQVCKLARNLVALGWGIDVAIGEGKVVLQTESLPLGKHYVPAWGGGTEILKTPGEGFVDDLERAYGAFRNRTLGKAMDADTRPRAYRPVPYRIADEPLGRLCVPFDLLDTQGEERQSFRCEDGMLISAWMRHAARQRFLLEGWDIARVDSYVSGHTSKGEENNRLSYVPLPSIGHTHSDARPRRALVVLPFNDENADESLAILYRMAGDPLLALDSALPIAWLDKGDKARDSVLECYLGKSVEWLSVTPVILHGHDFDRGGFRPRKAEKLILQAFAESGYQIENIAEFSYQPAPYWRGPISARQARVPKHLEKWPRYHVRVVFSASVSGPVLVGIGRHYGLGVFAAAR